VSNELFRRSIADLIPYEPGKPIEEVQRELGLDRVVKLASNEGPFPPFPAAIEAIQRATSELNRYPDGGAYALRSAIAEHHGVAMDEIVVGGGADGVIDLLSQSVLEEGDEIVCGWPSFPSYVLDALKAGAVPRKVPLRDHTYDLEAMLVGYRRTFNLPRLSARGLAAEDVAPIVAASRGGSMRFNPVELSDEELAGILRAAMNP